MSGRPRAAPSGRRLPTEPSAPNNKSIINTMSKKNVIVAALLLLCVSWAKGQQNTTADTIVYKGQNGSKAVVLNSLQDGTISFLSEDQRYLSGSISTAAGFVYDLTTGGLQIFDDHQMHAYFSPDHYVTALGGENQSPYLHLDGQDIDLEPTTPPGENAEYNSLSYWAAQPNGGRIVTMGYEYDRSYYNVGAVHDGKTGKLLTLLHSHWPLSDNAEDNAGYGSRGDCISGDGLIVGGHGTWPGCFSNWSLMFWDLADLESTGEVHTYGIDDPSYSQGSFYGANHDGSILVGDNENTGKGVILYFDRANKSFTYDSIDPLPGYDGITFTSISDRGLITGYVQSGTDVAGRIGTMYTQAAGVMTLKSFLLEFYDIDAPELGCPIGISPDGSIIHGFYFDHGYTKPWFIQLGDKQILPRVRNIRAKAAQSGFSARLDWQAPLASANTLTGYEIYRNNDDTPLATVDKDVLTYTDNSLTSGQYTYRVVAVYEEGRADARMSNPVQIIAADGYLPVQKIGNHLKYNRYASIYWGLPSSEVIENAMSPATLAAKGEGNASIAPNAVRTARPAEQARNVNPQAKYPNPQFDYVYDVNMLTYSGYGGIKIGDLYYVSSWQEARIRVMNENNEIVKILEPSMLRDEVLSMVYLEKDGKKLLYCGSKEKVYILDLETDDITETFEAEARHMTYMPDVEIEGTKGVLLAGDWNTAEYYTTDGQRLASSDFDFSALDVAGSAYYDGKLYVASQTGPNMNEIYTFDVATGKPSGEPVQVTEDPAVYDLLSLNGEVTSTDDLAYAAGLSIATLSDGTMALGAVFQCSYTHSRLMFLELEAAPGRSAYKLYRNGEVIAEALNTRRFYDELTEPGTYNYQVQAFGDGKQSELSPATTITIPAYDPCLPAKDLKARETNRWVVLDWDVPTSDSAAGLVGFNVYRDGVRLKQLLDLEANVTYTDFSTLELGKEYTYRIETLYSSGCAADTEVKITLNNEGEAMAPAAFHIDYKENPTASTADAPMFDVTASWETPMFEEPLAIGYGTGQMITGAGFEEVNEYYAGIGWDTTDLKLYKDLYLVGMEYMLADNVTKFEACVYLNDTLAYTEAEKRTVAREWQTKYFNKSIPMDQPDEVVVGYHIVYPASATPVAIDLSYSKPFYSDAISFDGVVWYSLAGSNLSASWCIRGLVVRKRDLDEATTAGVTDYKKLESKIMRLSNAPMQATLTPAATPVVSQASPKAPLTLQGFNLYRQRVDISGQEEVKLNGEELLKTFSFAEAEPLPQGDYDYTVEAVYANGTKSVTIAAVLERVSTEGELNGLSLTLFPNPATDVVYVNGEFDDLQILDLGGRVLRRLPSVSQIEVGNLTPGTYFFRFADKDGRNSTYKVVIR